MVWTLSLVAVALLGLCIGSFLNVVIYRVPIGTFRSGGSRSKCPSCEYVLRWFDNVPVVSWLVLRGKCRNCGASIGIRYPLVEVLTAAFLLLLFWHDAGPHLADLPPGTPLPGWDVWGALLFRTWFVFFLIACTFIDIDHRLLPNVLTKPTMVIGLVGAAVAPGLVGAFAQAPDWFDHVIYSAVGLVCGYLVTEGVRVGGSMVFGKEAMGYGDVKFMAAVGAFVGWDGALLTFFLGSLFGAVYGGIRQLVTKDGQIYFGPFLALGAALCLFLKAELVTFTTVTWPRWQASQQQSPVVAIGVALVCAVLLFFLIRRGRRSP